VRPGHRFQWQKKGWNLVGSETSARGAAVYGGKYRAGSLTWDGTIHAWNGRVDPYIYRPPVGDVEHRAPRHRRCFSEREDGWWYVHVNPPPDTVDNAIDAVEKLLREVTHGR
jgi:hypothetical protein